MTRSGFTAGRRPEITSEITIDVHEAIFRFYEELNDFLPPECRKRAFPHRFRGSPSVKDVIEAIGVPHTEIDVILVDGRSVGFAEKLRGGERVAVYPVFERLDVGPLVRLRERGLRRPRFIVDLHLERLGRYLRLSGIDAVSPRCPDDAAIVRDSLDLRRTVLTRDRGLLKRASLQRGYWVRSDRPRDQLVEVIRSFQLEDMVSPFSRCLICNTPLCSAEEAAVERQVPADVRAAEHHFDQCPDCGRVYWRGSHYRRMQSLLKALGLPCEPSPQCRVSPSRS